MNTMIMSREQIVFMRHLFKSDKKNIVNDSLIVDIISTSQFLCYCIYIKTIKIAAF